MRKRIALAVIGAALIAPAAVNAEPNTSLTAQVKGAGAQKAGKAERGKPQRAGYERRYLRLYERHADRFGVRETGRNLVLDGFRERDGDVRDARKGEVVKSAARMSAALAPQQAATVPAGAEVTEVAAAAPATGGAAASSATAQCESGGNYGAVNPAGYYGAYQFDQQTWDAYAPSGYQGTNPAQAPPAVQDQAAANVDYDAWPNC